MYLTPRTHWKILNWWDQPLCNQLTVRGRGLPPQQLRLHSGNLRLKRPATTSQRLNLTKTVDTPQGEKATNQRSASGILTCVRTCAASRVCRCSRGRWPAEVHRSGCRWRRPWWLWWGRWWDSSPHRCRRRSRPARRRPTTQTRSGCSAEVKDKNKNSFHHKRSIFIFPKQGFLVT